MVYLRTLHYVHTCTCTLLGWIHTNQGEQLVLGKMESLPGKSPSFHFSVTIESNLTWCVHVEGVQVPTSSSYLDGPDVLQTLSDVQSLLSRVNCSEICIGNPEAHFMAMIERRKRVIMDKAGKTYTHVYMYMYIDSNACVHACMQVQVQVHCLWHTLTVGLQTPQPFVTKTVRFLLLRGKCDVQHAQAVGHLCEQYPHVI